MQDTLIQKYEARRAPRYTSYPTAPHFSAAVGPAEYESWLAALPASARLSLYLHVPFCRTMCWYCGCHTKIVARDEPVEAYMAALGREVELVADRLPARMGVRSVHWGGGTPTIASPAAFGATMALLRRRFAFGSDAEIAVEADPRRLPPETVAALGEAGVTRASLGVQTFDPAVQQAINRVQSFEQTQAAAQALRRAGVRSLNFDLLYGLPRQTVASCIDTAERALELGPDRFAVFGYAHVPWMKTHQRLIKEAELPGAAERIAQFEAIGERLVGAGYRRVGLDHFARPDDGLAEAERSGALRRNFQGYTTDPAEALLGFGASAIGSLPQGYVQNDARTIAWGRAVEAGKLPTLRGVAIDDEDRLRRAVIEQIMCRGRVDLAEAAASHGRSWPAFEAEMTALRELEADGVVRVDGASIELEPGAELLMRNVAAVFDAYLAASELRHSRAL
jgi:oxygen-independent coproporphyrinogen-3 oxidase